MVKEEEKSLALQTLMKRNKHNFESREFGLQKLCFSISKFELKFEGGKTCAASEAICKNSYLQVCPKLQLQEKTAATVNLMFM